jgi:hypothetical protein
MIEEALDEGQLLELEKSFSMKPDKNPKIPNLRF